MPKKDKENNKETTALTTGETAGDAYSTALQTAKTVLAERFMTTLDGVEGDEAAEQQIMALQQALAPTVKGREEMNTRWTIPTVRIIQRMTRERPPSVSDGQMVTDGGEVLDASFKFVPLYLYEQNRMFQQGEFKAPTCFAPDGKMGSAFGACDSCPQLPMGKNTTGKMTDCDNGVCMVVMGQNLRLYRLEFYRTSKKAGLRVDQLVARQGNLWSAWFALTTKSISNPAKGDYYIFQVAPAEEDVPLHLQDAADALCDLITTERQAYLEIHYASVQQQAQSMGDVDERVDFDADTGDSTNPTDVSGDM
ncbi:MAG: hypothetical protein CMK74_00715 [Pseudomonadales bacterium]|nr:hypothetical protein [Pseudomonadales bacterium]|tara:strand:- start:415 stop:1338 length:924 start_codon:yes stop_codon:yes gene_type:complete